MEVQSSTLQKLNDEVEADQVTLQSVHLVKKEELEAYKESIVKQVNHLK